MSFQNNLPNTPITDIKLHQNDLVMSTMGRGFWILDNISSLGGMANLSQIMETENISAFLFKPEDASRMRYRMRGGGTQPDYPNPGVTIDYYLGETDGDVKLEIINEQGRVVKAFTSGKPEAVESLERDMATGFTNPPPSSGLSKKAGLNRFSWNMRHHSGWNKNEKRAYRGNGPMVSTGTFTARLSANGMVLSKNFEVMLDPRNSLVSDADVKAQEALALEIRDFQDEVNQLVEALSQKRKALENSLETEKVSRKQRRKQEALDKVYYQLVTAPGTYMQPMLQSQTGYLNSMLGRADQMPGKDAYDRLAELKSQFETIKKEAEALED